MAGPAFDGTFLACINMDMVGENLELIHTKMIVTRTPGSIPSVFNDVAANMAEMVSRMNIRTPRGSLSEFNYVITPYSGGSDHNIFIDRKIPGAMFGHSPDYTHHTSEDTPDKVDPVEIERCEIIGAGTMLYLANLEPEQAVDFAYLAGGNTARYLGFAGQRANRLMSSASQRNLVQMWAEAQNIIDTELSWQKETLASILYFNNAEQVKRVVANMQNQLERQHEMLSESLRMRAISRGIGAANPPALEENPDNRIPVRLTRGPLASGIPEGRLSPAEAEWYRSREFTLTGNRRFELHNFIDGKRAVSEIRNALSAEYGPVETRVVTRYIEDLIKAGVVKWK